MPGLGADRPQFIDCDLEPYKLLACAVILDAAKIFNPDSPMCIRECENFFLGPDYRWWAGIAGLKKDGQDILDALKRNGGLDRTWLLKVASSRKHKRMDLI